MRKINSLQRAAALRPAKRKFVLFSEGKNTEPDYFKAVQSLFRGALIELEIIPAAGVPFTIAENAVALQAKLNKQSKRGARRNSFADKDEVWAIFDRDEHPRVTDALRLCKDNNVGVAFSNPCFELRLILHISDFDKAVDRHEVQRVLAAILKDYDPKRGKTTECMSLVSSLAEAEKRAARQVQNRQDEGSVDGAPSTTVFLLTAAIRKAAEEHQGAKEK